VAAATSHPVSLVVRPVSGGSLQGSQLNVRQDLEKLDEARALQRLLAIHGSQTALAQRLHRSQGWVSQRLALLSLTPELQAHVGKDPIDLLRAVGSMPPEQQEAALEALKQERARKETEKQGTQTQEADQD
jgi:ParB family chromosome partitioning protein